MCVPVLPATQHPLSREPLAPSRPLPWPDRYHYTMCPMIECRIAKTFADPSNATQLPRSERSRLAECFEEDLSRSDMLRYLYLQNARTPSEPDTGRYSPTSLRGQDAGSFDKGHHNIASAHALPSVMYTGNSSQDTVVVKASYDLSEALDLADPAEFWREQEFLRRHVTFCTARTVPHSFIL
jgi:hypothetical protein